MRRIILLFVVLLLPSLPAGVQAQPVTVTLDPLSGPPGTTLTLRGQGAPARKSFPIYHYPWFADAQCEIPMDMVESLSATTDGSGRFVAMHRAEKMHAEQVGMVYSVIAGDWEDRQNVCFRFTTADSRTFPETGKTLNGRLLQYWEDNGALPVFGYPITEAQNERNHDTDNTFLTQWFERNRFELHPENRTPYDVLLGRLGADRLQQIGRNWQAEGREQGPKPDCLWFPATGHNVCNQASSLDIPIGIIGFADYWSRFGIEFDGMPGSSYAESLALFGLPLTAARMETNSSGDRVLTQWFERARFEWHPSEPASINQVMLGLLGNEVQGRK